ncbi:hypothetical protein C8046_03715 [Serinibacter arcticus]|uniref:ABC transmembrane type-1 domain-containing protein n=1 Tax=Serinibacter arcticus TaxID=1655435 RepID=A0A2U1ZSI7_9MICO|nr:ABC transporter permease [Serinibacter arcticus]PWD49921.1 hypothetical protein C8046_03715 [Serinibacter arcticus]
MSAVAPPLSGSARARWALVGIAGTAVLWQVGALLTANQATLPTLTSVLAEIGALSTDPALRTHVLTTLGRVLAGFLVGSVLGLVTGSLIGAFSWVRRILNPYLNFLRAIAPIAWIVPATIWLGVGESSIQFVVIYAAVFPVAINTISGMASLAPDRARMGRVFGLSPAGIFWQIRIPNAVPFALTGARLGLGLAFMATIGAEMIIGQSGLGYLIYDARVFFDTPLMFAGILLLGVVGYLGDLGFAVVRTRVFSRYYAGRTDA